VPSSSARRPRFAASLAAVAAAVVLLGGCTGQHKPTKYGDGVEAAFVKGCTTTLEADTKDAEVRVDDPAGVCQCAYDKLSADKGGVEFGRVKAVDDDLSEEAAALPDDIAKAVADCAP